MQTNAAFVSSVKVNLVVLLVIRNGQCCPFIRNQDRAASDSRAASAIQHISRLSSDQSFTEIGVQRHPPIKSLPPFIPLHPSSPLYCLLSHCSVLSLCFFLTSIFVQLNLSLLYRHIHLHWSSFILIHYLFLYFLTQLSLHLFFYP